MNELERQLRSGTPSESEAAAHQLAERGDAQVLAAVATDATAEGSARVTALRYLPPTIEFEKTLAALLADPYAVLRVIALEKVAEAHVASLLPLVEQLTHDPARFWDLDEEISVAETASRTLAALRG